MLWNKTGDCARVVPLVVWVLELCYVNVIERQYRAQMQKLLFIFNSQPDEGRVLSFGGPEFSAVFQLGMRGLNCLLVNR